MKKKLNIGFVVTLSGRWPRELPEKRLKEYGDWLEQNAEHAEVFRFPCLVSSKDDMNECAAYFTENKVDLIVLVYGAFTGDDIPCGLADKCRCPIVLWAPREEKWERQDRLYANALCSATMNGASLARIHAPHSVIFGDKEEARVKTEISNLISAYAVIKNLQGFTFGLFGYRPTAFYNCAFDETVIRRVFGINFEETDLKVVFDTMAELPWSEVEAEMARIDGDWDTKALPDGHLENHARLYLALKQLVAKQGYEYSALKCWPEMGNLHTTPCAVIGRLADEGIGLSCEGDVDAGLAAIVQTMLTDQPTFITDLINIDESENTVTFWHCGNAAPSLHDVSDGVTMCNHPLAGQGTAFWCALKSGPVTAARFTNIDGQYRLFLLRGEALPTTRNTRGAMVNVKVDTPVLELVQKIAESGMSHHYSVVWQDVADAMIAVAKVLDIPVIEL